MNIHFFFYKTIFSILLIINIIIFIENLQNPKVRKSNDIFSKHKLYIEAHRGFNKEIFENTMESFQKAIDLEIDSIESDVWLTKDNELVLLHANSRSGSLSNYYDHEGNVIELTWDELSKYRTIKNNLTMPRLSDLMKIAKNKIYINLEIKDKRIDVVFPHLIKLIEKYDFFDQILISSPFFEYYSKVLEYNIKYGKKLVFGFIYDKNSIDTFDYSKKGNTLNIYWGDATKEVCRKAHENGMAIIAWIDVFEEDTIDIYNQLIENKVDVICCNRPNMLQAYLKKHHIY